MNKLLLFFLTFSFLSCWSPSKQQELALWEKQLRLREEVLQMEAERLIQLKKQLKSVQETPADLQFTRYENARFHFCVDYPQGIFFPQAPPDNGDGRRFLSKDAQIEMVASGIYNLEGYDSYSLFERDIHQYGEFSSSKDRVITHQVQKDDWYVVSGYEEGKIFYKKVFTNGKVTWTLSYRYPESYRELMDAVIQIAAGGFPNCGS